MDLIHALAIAVLQGATELFPVSSLGHAVVVPAVLKWGIDQRSHEFLPFLVLLHAGTVVALLSYFWRDYWSLFVGLFGMDDAHNNREARRVVLLMVIATIPAVVIGFTLRKYIAELFASPVICAAFLIANGAMLLFGETLRGSRVRTVDTLNWVDALVIGCFQCLAFFPGVSRSGSTMVGGLIRGINHEGAAHFSFLIATPVIFGATVLEVPKLLHERVAPGVFGMAAIAAVVAGITAWISTWLLMRYFRSHASWALTPFALYCLAVGGGALGLLRFG